MVHLAGAHLSDRVAIVGRRELPLMLELCRRGFVEATCTDPAAPRTSGEVELLLISANGSEASLRQTLSRFARSLRAGGTILLHEGSGAASVEPSPRIRMLRRTLLALGFVPLQQIPDGAGGFLLAARKPAAAVAKAA
jgi:hypothetical protein